MMDEITDPNPAATPGNRRSVLLGAVLGAVALAGTIVGVSTVAGAQDEPNADTTTSKPEHEEGDFIIDGDELFDDERWEPFEECIDNQLGDITEPDFDSEPTEEEWAALDAAWEAADAACADLLPEDVQAEMEAWEAFDQCLADAGVLDEDFGTAVHIETGDGLQVVEFGEVSGSVTITGDADGVVVATDGGVTVLDEAALDAEWEAFDAAHSACEDLLPEDIFEGEFLDDLLDDELFED